VRIVVISISGLADVSDARFKVDRERKRERERERRNDWQTISFHLQTICD